jgi:amino acid transporter
MQEYDKLKSEQTHRIGFRDNMVYVHLVVVGGVASFAISESSHVYALLIIPWICFVLGWTYVNNDAKISEIAAYFTKELTERICKELDLDKQVLFEWEVGYVQKQRRRQRRRLQFIVDEITFCASGACAILAYWLIATSRPWGLIILSAIEVLLLGIIGYEIYVYADYKPTVEKKGAKVRSAKA